MESLTLVKKYAKHFDCLLQALRIDRYSLLGYCQGGCTALVAASKAADRVEKLVIWSCFAFVTDWDVEYHETTRDFRCWPENRKRLLIEQYGEKYSSDSWNAWVDVHRTALREHDGEVCRRELPGIVTPTLVLHGDQDKLVPVEHSVYLHENIKGSK